MLDMWCSALYPSIHLTQKISRLNPELQTYTVELKKDMPRAVRPMHALLYLWHVRCSQDGVGHNGLLQALHLSGE